jgi:transposase-like protein
LRTILQLVDLYHGFYEIMHTGELLDFDESLVDRLINKMRTDIQEKY